MRFYAPALQQPGTERRDWVPSPPHDRNVRAAASQAPSRADFALEIAFAVKCQKPPASASRDPAIAPSSLRRFNVPPRSETARHAEFARADRMLEGATGALRLMTGLQGDAALGAAPRAPPCQGFGARARAARLSSAAAARPHAFTEPSNAGPSAALIVPYQNTNSVSRDAPRSDDSFESRLISL